MLGTKDLNLFFSFSLSIILVTQGLFVLSIISSSIGTHIFCPLGPKSLSKYLS